MSSTGHAIRDPFFDRSHRLIAQLLPVQRQRRHRCAPGTSSPGQGFQNPRRNGGLRIRESIHQIVKFFSGAYLHGSNLAHPSRPDPMVPAGKRRPENRQTTSAQRSACEKRRQPNGIDRQLLDSPFRSPRPVTRSSSSTGALSAVTAAHRCHRSRSPAQWRGSAARRPERRRKGPAPCRRSPTDRPSRDSATGVSRPCGPRCRCEAPTGRTGRRSLPGGAMRPRGRGFQQRWAPARERRRPGVRGRAD